MQLLMVLGSKSHNFHLSPIFTNPQMPVFLHLCVYIFVCTCKYCACACQCTVCAFICIRACLCKCVSMCVLSPILCEQGLDSVWVDEEAGEGAVLVCVPSMDLPSIQLHTHLIAHIQMQDHTVGGIVVILISVLSDGTGSYLSPTEDIRIDN